MSLLVKQDTNKQVYNFAKKLIKYLCIFIEMLNGNIVQDV